jgi:hypothetical protein
MSLGQLIGSIIERRRRSARRSYEEGAQIKRRLQELISVPAPTQNVETVSETPSVKTNQQALGEAA